MRSLCCNRPRPRRCRIIRKQMRICNLFRVCKRQFTVPSTDGTFCRCIRGWQGGRDILLHESRFRRSFGETRWLCSLADLRLLHEAGGPTQTRLVFAPGRPPDIAAETPLRSDMTLIRGEPTSDMTINSSGGRSQRTIVALSPLLPRRLTDSFDYITSDEDAHDE